MSSLTYYLASLLTAVSPVLAANEVSNLPWGELTDEMHHHFFKRSCRCCICQEHKGWMQSWGVIGRMLRGDLNGRYGLVSSTHQYLRTDCSRVPMEALQVLSDSLRSCLNDIGLLESDPHYSKSFAILTSRILTMWGFGCRVMSCTFPGTDCDPYFYNMVEDGLVSDNFNGRILIDLCQGTEQRDEDGNLLTRPQVHLKGKHLFIAHGGPFDVIYNCLKRDIEKKTKDDKYLNELKKIKSCYRLRRANFRIDNNLTKLDEPIATALTMALDLEQNHTILSETDAQFMFIKNSFSIALVADYTKKLKNKMTQASRTNMMISYE